MWGVVFILNTPSAYAVSSVLHPPVESAVVSGRWRLTAFGQEQPCGEVAESGRSMALLTHGRRSSVDSFQRCRRVSNRRAHRRPTTARASEASSHHRGREYPYER